MKRLMQIMFMCGLMANSFGILSGGYTRHEEELDLNDKTGFLKEVMRPLEGMMIDMTQSNANESLEKLKNAIQSNPTDKVTIEKLKNEAEGRTIVANAVKAAPRWFSAQNVHPTNFNENAYKACLKQISEERGANITPEQIASTIAQREKNNKNTPFIDRGDIYIHNEERRQTQIAFNVLYTIYLQKHPEIQKIEDLAGKKGYAWQAQQSFLEEIWSDSHTPAPFPIPTKMGNAYAVYKKGLAFPDSYDKNVLSRATIEISEQVNQARNEAQRTVKNITAPSMFQRFMNTVKSWFGPSQSSITRFSADYDSTPKKSYFNWPNIRQYAPVMPTREKMIARAAKARAMQYNPAPESAAKALKQQERFGIGYQ